MARGTYHFLEGEFEEAEDWYDHLRNDYPNSEHHATATLLGLRTKLNLYQGAKYDETPLVEAAELIDQMLVQFPDAPPDERQRLLQARATVQAMLAERHWSMSDYYYRSGYNRAARYYCQNIIDEFPDTRFADLARQRLAATAGLPPEPDNPLEQMISIWNRSGDDALEPVGEIASEDTLGTLSR